MLLASFSIWAAFLSNSSFDRQIFDSTAPHISESRTRFMLFITGGGNTDFLIITNLFLIFFFVYKKNKWWAVRVAAVSLSSLGLMSLLKNLIQRHRPPSPMIDGVTNYSFPSGHAFMSVAFYGLLILLAAGFIKNKWIKAAVVSFFILLIFLIGFSRIYLRMHYATDVIAGLSLSTAWLILSFVVIGIFQTRHFAKEK